MKARTPHPMLAPAAVLAAILAAPALAPVPAAAAERPSSSPPAAAVVREDSVLHVRVVGRGRPLLLLPGLSSAGEVWDGAVARYRDRYECHVVTLGGFAGRPRFEGPFLATARDALVAYMRRHALRDPVVMGHSLGGTLALMVAIEAPDAVGALVMLDALSFAGGAAGPDVTVDAARARMAPFRDMIRSQSQEQYVAFQRQSPFLREMVAGEDDRRRIREWGEGSDRRTVADAMYELNTTDLRPSLGRVRAPALVLGTWYGMRAMTTPARVDSLFRAQFAGLPRLSFALADTARHFVMLDAPDWTWGQVDAFLAAHARGGDLGGRKP